MFVNSLRMSEDNEALLTYFFGHRWGTCHWASMGSRSSAMDGKQAIGHRWEACHHVLTACRYKTTRTPSRLDDLQPPPPKKKLNDLIPVNNEEQFIRIWWVAGYRASTSSRSYHRVKIDGGRGGFDPWSSGRSSLEKCKNEARVGFGQLFTAK